MLAHRRKFVLILGVACMIFLLNRLMFTAIRSEHRPNVISKGELFQRLQKEKRLEKIRRISENFQPYQNKFMSYQPLNVTKKRNNNFDNDDVEVHIETNLTVNAPKETYDIDIEAPDSYKLYFRDTEEDELNDPYVNLHKFEYKISNEFACNSDVLAVIMVNSSPGKVKERTAIRETWGSVRYYLGATVVTMFMLAKTNDIKLQADIEKESQTYQDIVQGNFIDSYRNLTYKTVMGLHWVRTYCNRTKFALKVDDDTMVDVYHLVTFLLQKSPDGNVNNFLYCSVYKNQGPVRRSSDKWFVPNHEYPYAKYPPYCEGFAYIMSNDVTRYLYETSAKVKFYWIDDVYITGLVAYLAGIAHHSMESGHAYDLMQSEHLSKHVQSSIFLLAKYEHLRANWDNAWSDIKTVHNIE